MAFTVARQGSMKWIEITFDSAKTINIVVGTVLSSRRLFHRGRKNAQMLRLLEFLPARRYASAGNSDRNVSVCLSVCPSRAGIVSKQKKTSGMISSPSGSPKTLVFWRQISSPNSKGFPPNGVLKQGSVGKIQRFFSFKRLYLENGSRYGQSYY